MIQFCEDFTSCRKVAFGRSFASKDESFLAFPSDRPGANVRQMDGVAGEAWGGESGTDRIVRIQYGQ